MTVKFFLRDLAGDAVSAIDRRDEDVAVVLDRSRYQALSIEARVRLINRALTEAHRPSGTQSPAVLELLAS